MSKIIESLRGDMAALHEAGAISKGPALKLLNIIASKGLQAIL